MTDSADRERDASSAGSETPRETGDEVAGDEESVSDKRTASTANRERGPSPTGRRAADESNGEQREPRDDPEEAVEESRSDGPGEGGSHRTDGGQEVMEGVSLNIAGHERRGDRGAAPDGPGDDADAAAPFSNGDDEGDDGTALDLPTDDDDGEGVEPVELLVQLADRGEIEPWDIDIVAVTDAFLDALDDADIRTGGRALFYASVLLRMKSDALMEADDPQEPEPWEEPWDAPPADADEDWQPDPFDALDREMDRRLERKRARGMPETLDELVRELREAERGSWWKESRTYDTSDSPKGFRRGTQTLDYHSADDFRLDDEPTAQDVTGTAHQEDMETTIQHVYRALREQYDAGRSEVLFAEVEDAGGARVETFLALLFLAHRKQVRLDQDELFGDLWIQDPAANETPAEAVAD